MRMLVGTEYARAEHEGLHSETAEQHAHKADNGRTLVELLVNVSDEVPLVDVPVRSAERHGALLLDAGRAAPARNRKTPVVEGRWGNALPGLEPWIPLDVTPGALVVVDAGVHCTGHQVKGTSSAKARVGPDVEGVLPLQLHGKQGLLVLDDVVRGFRSLHADGQRRGLVGLGRLVESGPGAIDVVGRKDKGSRRIEDVGAVRNPGILQLHLHPREALVPQDQRVLIVLIVRLQAPPHPRRLGRDVHEFVVLVLLRLIIFTFRALGLHVALVAPPLVHRRRRSRALRVNGVLAALQLDGAHGLRPVGRPCDALGLDDALLAAAGKPRRRDVGTTGPAAHTSHHSAVVPHLAGRQCVLGLEDLRTRWVPGDAAHDVGALGGEDRVRLRGIRAGVSQVDEGVALRIRPASEEGLRVCVPPVRD
mmetsp:Transcript_80544/g.181750  ORF Transcript_80544/g.181750 Transcript_80544/m.181750 type:complete len:421 (+) Transcript_80544:2748-4010(+)